MVILDTNIIIDHLRQREKTTRLRRIAISAPEENLRLSIISIQELYVGLSTRGRLEEQVLQMTIQAFEILPYTYEIAKQAGELMRDSQSLLKFADAAIAATAITHGALLYTLNRRHFAPVPGLELYEGPNA